MYQRRDKEPSPHERSGGVTASDDEGARRPIGAAAKPTNAIAAACQGNYGKQEQGAKLKVLKRTDRTLAVPETIDAVPSGGTISEQHCHGEQKDLERALRLGHLALSNDSVERPGDAAFPHRPAHTVPRRA